MPPPIRVPLLQGAYTARSIIAAAQRSLNLYPEKDPAGEDSPTTIYLTPGLSRLGIPAQAARVRGLYRASNERLYAAVGNAVYHVWRDWTTTFLGRMGIAWGSDLVIGAANSVTSASYTFVAGDVGNYVEIIAGTGFTVGEYRVDSVAAGAATLHSSPGTVGSTGGTWNLVEAPNVTLESPAVNIRTGPVKMQDNGTTLVIVDGSSYGWSVKINDDSTYARIVDPNFFGGNFVEIIDTYFIFNKPGTNIFYISPSNYLVGPNGTDLVIAADGSVTSASYTFLPTDVGATLNITAGTGFLVGYYIILSVSLGAATLDTPAGTPGSTGGTWAVGQTFDPLSFAAKVGYPDLIAGITAQNRNIWIIGWQATSEIWFDAGAADFPFQIISGPFIQYGTISPYSIANFGGSTFWLSQNLGGSCYVVEGSNLAAQRVSTEAVEAAISSYRIQTDATAFVYTQSGHSFYWLKFPSEGVDWVYDITTKLWHERAWLNPSNCAQETHRAFCSAYAYNTNIVGDSETGQIYQLDLTNPTDAGDFIERRRGFPHMMANGNRAIYPSFVADVQDGTVTLADSGGGGEFVTGTNHPVVTVIDTTFTAYDGTLLQDYGWMTALNSPIDPGSQYTQIDFTTSAVIENDMLTGTGQTEYLASGKPTSPDYIAQFQVIPAGAGIAPAGKQIYLIGRANASNNGYKVAIVSNGTIYHVALTVMGGATSTVDLGTLISGYYQVFLSMQGSAIDVAVQRSEDAFWVTSGAAWQAGFTKAISITDTTYATAGNVLIGGVW